MTYLVLENVSNCKPPSTLPWRQKLFPRSKKTIRAGLKWRKTDNLWEKRQEGLNNSPHLKNKFWKGVKHVNRRKWVPNTNDDTRLRKHAHVVFSFNWVNTTFIVVMPAWRKNVMSTYFWAYTVLHTWQAVTIVTTLMPQILSSVAINHIKLLMQISKITSLPPEWTKLFHSFNYFRWPKKSLFIHWAPKWWNIPIRMTYSIECSTVLV